MVPNSNLGYDMAQAFLVNDRMYQLIIEYLDPRAWRAKPPGRGARTIAGIFSHVHNMRRKWLRLSAPHMKLPRLDRTRCSQKQAASALAESAARCCKMLTETLNAAEGGAGSFLRDGWARPWRPGAAMFAYMITHDAHHRGQICMLAHQLGFPLPVQAMAGIWNWERLSKDCGFQLAAPQKAKRPAQNRALEKANPQRARK